MSFAVCPFIHGLSPLCKLYAITYDNDYEFKEYFGWAQDSKMAAVYIHLSGRGVDNALFNVYGIKSTVENKESIMKSKECVRCHPINQAINRFCSRCGLPLDEHAKAEVMR